MTINHTADSDALLRHFAVQAVRFKTYWTQARYLYEQSSGRILSHFFFTNAWASIVTIDSSSYDLAED